MRLTFLFLTPLVLTSGFTALVYQCVWIREFRLIFGASTPATASVMAIFMAGLGFGGYYFGKKLNTEPRPIWRYAQLELGIAISAAASPLLLDLSKWLFFQIGGSFALGPFWGTLVRFLLSILVLGVPTFLMGGTMPALASGFTSFKDHNRSRFAFLYGINTMGAVFGVFAANFYFLEKLGNRSTLWASCMLNLVVFLGAWALSRRRSPDISAETQSPAATSTHKASSIVPFAAGVVGFVFVLMELVWYRMLGPILGGSTFTFGVILIVALLGIGVGGLSYSVIARKLKPSLAFFALTCAAEAFFLILPFACGDLCAEFAWFLGSRTAGGFLSQIAIWFAVTLPIVFLPSVIAGAQFPLLISFMGEGKAGIARDTGVIYLTNTIGSVLGSLVGGFGILPILGAEGTWRAASALLVAVAGGAICFRAKQIRKWEAASAFVVIATLPLLFAAGPTAVWRHSAIGAGRIEKMPANPNSRKELEARLRRGIEWQRDGMESSVGLSRNKGYGVTVNGKSDGNIYADAGTQIMGGLIGGLLLPKVQSACVIGLGTGSTSGWLASIPGIERVDTIELEPAIAAIAKSCAPANRNALDNPKHHLVIGDGREWLLVTDRQYDLIFSEPSNPYRAGVASLFTQDFYKVASKRLNKNGLFLQWLQAYEIDAESITGIYATFSSVFPEVQSWATLDGDLLLVGSRQRITVSVDELRNRIGSDPFRAALSVAWKTDSLEGLLARYIGGGRLLDFLKNSGSLQINTDDKNLLEFAVGRTVGKQHQNRIDQLFALSASLKDRKPESLVHNEIDWTAVEQTRALVFQKPVDSAGQSKFAREIAFVNAFRSEDLAQAATVWLDSPWISQDESIKSWVACSLAAIGNPLFRGPMIDLQKNRPVEANAILAIYQEKNGETEKACNNLVKSFEGFREDPWADEKVMSFALQLATLIAKKDGTQVDRLLEALSEPFAVSRLWNAQQRVRFELAVTKQPSSNNKQLYEAIQSVEPNPFWESRFLSARAKIYEEFSSPLAGKARRDLAEFLKAEVGSSKKQETSEP